MSSGGFAGSQTRGLSELDREIEYRLGRLTHLDVFTDDFSPPGAVEAGPGQDFRKRKFEETDAPHDDLPPSKPGTPSTRPMAAAGNARDQEGLDQIDRDQRQVDAPIKKPGDQFPGGRMEKHSFHDRVEKRMLRLVSGGAPEEDRPADQEMVSGTPEADNADVQSDVHGPSEADKRDEQMMLTAFAEVDEALWQKAKDASQQAFGKIKWPFVTWWYQNHGGK